jgi:hypothetical protein
MLSIQHLPPTLSGIDGDPLQVVGIAEIVLMRGRWTSAWSETIMGDRRIITPKDLCCISISPVIAPEE